MARPSRAPYTAVRTDVAKDESFAVLGSVAGYNRHEALGRMVELWNFCRDRGLEDAPDGCTGYAVHEAVVRHYLGPRGVEAILGDGCDAFALGTRWGEGMIYLKGTDATVAALRGFHRSAEAGGKARAAHSKRQGGRFTDAESVRQSNNHQLQRTCDVPVDQPQGTCDEPVTSLPPSSFLLPPKEERASRPRRAPSGPQQLAIAHFQARSEKATGAPYDPSQAECVNLARLVAKRGHQDAIARIDRLFDGRGPDWLRAPFTIATVVSNWNQLAIDSEPAQPKSRGGPSLFDGIRPTTLLG